MTSNEAITEWLQRFREDPEAERNLISALYPALRRRARYYMSMESPDSTLQPTALIHETYLQLVRSEDRTWTNRAHFLAAAAQSMRRILIDCARARNARKRGGDFDFVRLEDGASFATDTPENFLELNAAMDKLSELDPELMRVVELRFFVGLTEEETAEILQVSVRTIKRRWQAAKGLLRQSLSKPADDLAVQGSQRKMGGA